MKANEYEILMQEALELTARYFDGDTSLAEERRLRALLAEPGLMAEELDEARAVMGFVLFDKPKDHGRRQAHADPGRGRYCRRGVGCNLFHADSGQPLC